MKLFDKIQFRFAVRSSVTLGCLAMLCLSSAIRGQSLSAVPVINTVAGGTNCATATDAFGDGCPATQVKLLTNWSSTSDGAGNLYIADSGNNLIRRVDAKTGIVSLVAGGATTVCAAHINAFGDGCPATQAILSSPRGIGFDHFGNLVFIDTTHEEVRSINMQTGIITSISGTGVAAAAIPSNTNPLPSNATAIDNPVAFAFDPEGNLYLPNSSKYYFTQVVANDGVIIPDQSLAYNIAGTGSGGKTGDGGPATSATVNATRGVVVDPFGNIIFADYSNFAVREISSPYQNGKLQLPPDSTMSKIAGTYTSGSTGNGGPATSATLTNVPDIAFDPSGNLYILTFGSPGDYVRIVDRKTQIINNYAGTGVRGTAGDGGPALLGEFNGAESLSVDRFGHLFINAYTGANVRSVSLNTLFSWTPVGSPHAAQNIAVQASNALTLEAAAIAPAGSQEFSIGTPTGCSVGGSLAANAYCTFSISFTPSLPGLRTAQLKLMDNNSVQTSIGLSGFGMAPAVKSSLATIATIAGTGTAGNAGMTGLASMAQVHAPRGGVVDGAGNVYFADSGNNVIRKIDLSGNITSVVGNGIAGYVGDGSAATSAELNAPTNVAIDSAGNLYIADSGNNRIRMVDANTGSISTIAGTGAAGYAGDTGDATAALLNNPQGLALQPDGTLYVADTGNNVVRRFFPRTGYISTVAGNGTAGYAGDGGYPTFAALNAPSAITIDNSGNLYIADSGNAVIRTVAPFGEITTFAGKQGTTVNGGDGGSATLASLVAPSDVALDAAGDLYIATGGEVRMINTSGIITTVAGSSTTGDYTGEGGIGTGAVLPSTAANIMVDAVGGLYISSTAGNRLLTVSAASLGTLDLGVQPPNSTGSPHSFTVLNTGNTPLVFSNIAISADFSLQMTDPNACTSTTSLPPGQTCTLNVSFSPTALGTQTGSIILTDNVLGAAAATQTINLTGVSRFINVTTTTVTVAPMPLVYGAATPTATATIGGGTATTGNVVFSVNGKTIATVPISGGAASTPILGLQAGPATIVASYQGDDNNASSFGNTAVMVQPATLTVMATNTTRPSGTPNPSFAYTFSGLVNGDTSAVISGTPSIITTAVQGSPEGTYPITITQGTLSATNYVFAFVNGTLTITTGPPYGYTLAAVVPVLTVRPTESAVEALTLTPVGGFTGTITFACSGAPASYSCVFNPVSVAMTGAVVQTTQVTLKNSGSAALGVDPLSFRHRIPYSGVAMWAFTFPFAFGWIWNRKRGKANLGKLAVWMIASMLIGGFTVGCGQATPPKKYTITITATDGTTTPRVQTASFEVDISN